MSKPFQVPKSLKKTSFHYCPGCQHGVAHRLVCEVIDELGIQDKSLAISSIGCSVFLYFYIDVDMTEAPHGRACAAATGAKRARPDLVVFTYQGDGDFAAIGFNESFQAAARGEKITSIMINNTIYGMTGGQASPTTLPGQKTTTTPAGRDPEIFGYPPKIAEILATLEGVAYSARVALNSPKRIVEAKRAIKNAFLAQINNLGFGFVEILSTCPINWKMDPVSAVKAVDKVIEYFPLGIFKDKVTPFLKNQK
jgi:2-oxoglutarate ferredoxin oxidoreductase subunit beta